MAEVKELMKNVSRSVEDFSIDLYKLVAGETKGNLVSSPLSAHLVLAMAAYGAKGNTAEEMRKVLYLPGNDDAALQGFQYFIDALSNTRSSTVEQCKGVLKQFEEEDETEHEIYKDYQDVIEQMNAVPQVTLNLASKIFASDKIAVKDEFKKLTETYFRSKCEVLNLKNAVESAEIVNQWCNDKTDGKIKEILSSGDLNPDVALILLNAVYFKGNWKQIFESSKTDMQLFHTDKNTSIEVPTMHMGEKKHLYKEIEELNAQCIILPYEVEDIVMEIIVPKEIDGLEHIEKNLEKIKHSHGGEGYKYHDVILSLPKFKIDSMIDLNSHLPAMGMKDMFTSQANFEGIADEPLSVIKALQKASITVNEEGTEGFANFRDLLKKRSFKKPPPPINLQVDRPFFYRVLHKKQNFTIFIGRVVKPTYND